jgi:hypothetical protein
VHRIAINELESCREEIYELITGFEYLSEDSKNEMIAYLESYYNSASQEKFLDRNISITCR